VYLQPLHDEERGHVAIELDQAPEDLHLLKNDDPNQRTESL
jgi:hypothetical protein